MTVFYLSHGLAGLDELLDGDDAVRVRVESGEDVVHVELDVLALVLKEILSNV